MSAIRFRGLAKSFGGVEALTPLSLDVPTGSVFALLGSNGAGKSTAIKLAMGFAQPSAGSIEVLGHPAGHDDPDLKRQVAYISETQMYPAWMTVRRLIRFHSSFYPDWDHARCAELLKQLHLVNSQRIGVLSKGQRRQVALLLALCQNAKLMILDEPFSGLDVSIRRTAIGLLVDFMSEPDRTLVISSHILTDLERIATHVGILHRGELFVCDELEQLHERCKTLVFHIDPPDPDTLEGWSIVGRRDRAVTVSNFSAERWANLLETCDSPPSLHSLGLEEIFLAYAGSTADSESRA